MGEDPRVGPWLRHVAANVRRLRERRGLAQEQLANEARVAPRYLQEVERARTNMSLAMLVRLAETLEVDRRRLLRPAPPLAVARRGRPPGTRRRTDR